MTKKTIVTRAGNNPKKYSGNVNVPVFQTSTLIFDKFADLERDTQTYGSLGTDTNHAFAEAVCRL